MSNIEYRARADWASNKITLSVMALSTPYTGASMFFDLSPEQAERLAVDLQTSVKLFRDLESAAQQDLAPRTIYQKGCRIRLKNNPLAQGITINDVPQQATGIPVLWDCQEFHTPVMAMVDQIEVIP